MRVLAHKPVPSDDFMPPGWCGGCEVCSHYPAWDICLACSYREWPYTEPVDFPCQINLMWQRAMEARQ